MWINYSLIVAALLGVACGPEQAVESTGSTTDAEPGDTTVITDERGRGGHR